MGHKQQILKNAQTSAERHNREFALTFYRALKSLLKRDVRELLIHCVYDTSRLMVPRYQLARGISAYLPGQRKGCKLERTRQESTYRLKRRSFPLEEETLVLPLLRIKKPFVSPKRGFFGVQDDSVDSKGGGFLSQSGAGPKGRRGRFTFEKRYGGGFLSLKTLLSVVNGVLERGILNAGGSRFSARYHDWILIARNISVCGEAMKWGIFLTEKVQDSLHDLMVGSLSLKTFLPVVRFSIGLCIHLAGSNSGEVTGEQEKRSRDKDRLA
ncbi:hypothetical protein DL93DRAFT_2103320 [Clavulina sp. PMI_390]|nr:hypothetical protein DL93DRAFT_2103320 [Clavulina sp. PMI_390]